MPIFYGEHRVGESKLNLWRDGFGNLLQLFKMRLSLARRPRPRTARPLAVGGAVQETCADPGAIAAPRARSPRERGRTASHPNGPAEVGPPLARSGVQTMEDRPLDAPRNGTAASRPAASIPRLRTSVLVLLFSMALLPRITGLITFFNADEDWGASVRVLTGDLSGWTSQTLPLVNYLNAASFVPLYAVGRLVGVWHGTADFRAQYFRDPTPFIFAGRFVAACLGALTAVLAALIAGRLGLSRRSSLLVGAMVAVYPMDVWLSHLAKTDSGVAFGVLLLAWSILCKLDNPASKGADALVGLALAVVVSFKQTAILVAPPLLLGMTALLRWDCDRPWSGIARGLVVSLAACVLAWIPMNLGALLDFKNFLEWQRFTLVITELRQPTSAYHMAELAVLRSVGRISRG